MGHKLTYKTEDCFVGKQTRKYLLERIIKKVLTSVKIEGAEQMSKTK